MCDGVERAKRTKGKGNLLYFWRFLSSLGQGQKSLECGRRCLNMQPSKKKVTAYLTRTIDLVNGSTGRVFLNRLMLLLFVDMDTARSYFCYCCCSRSIVFFVILRVTWTY